MGKGVSSYRAGAGVPKDSLFVGGRSSGSKGSGAKSAGNWTRKSN